MRLINKNSKRGIVNLFAEFILSKIDKNKDSIIQVSDVGSFYAVNGITTSEIFLDINLIRDEFTEKFKEILIELNIKLINVVDVINYNQKISNIETGWVKVNKIPFTQEYEPLSEISINSEFPYGHSLNCGRLMVYYTQYMFNQVYSTIMTDEVHFFFTKELNDDEDFNIKIVPKSGLDKTIIKSLILDLFDFDLKDFETKVANFKEKVQKKQQNFDKNSAEILKSIEQEMQKIVSKIVSEEKYDIIFQAMGLAYYPKNKDISDKVLDKLNSSLSSVALKKP